MKLRKHGKYKEIENLQTRRKGRGRENQACLNKLTGIEPSVKQH